MPPPGWQMVRFGDVAEKVNDKVDPDTCGLERYVAGDHVDSDDLHIRRWGTIGDGYLGPAFHMRFRKGHILYGSRRTYLRKVAVADFDGICANTTLVITPKDDAILPELLPFVMLTESFTRHSVEQTRGGVTPYVNWRDLATYEFALPPKPEQRRIAEILWAADEAGQQFALLRASALTMFAAELRRAFDHGAAGMRHWPQCRLHELASVDRGRFGHRPRNLPRFYGGSYPFAQTGDVADADCYLRKCSWRLSEEGRALSRSFPPSSVLITIAAVIGATAITTEETWCTDSVVGVVPGERLDVRFLEYFLRSKRNWLSNYAATQTAQKNINLAVLRPMLIPVPTIEEQRRLVLRLDGVSDIARRSFTHADAIRKLSRTLLSDALLDNDVH
jgi:type I restriction enzyme, S subunit